MPKIGIFIIGSVVGGAIILGMASAGDQILRQHGEILIDVSSGKTLSGAQISQVTRVGCFDKADRDQAVAAMHSTLQAIVSGHDDRVDDGPELVKQLAFKERCTVVQAGTLYDLTPSGAHHFTTLHGAADLWTGS
jgi:hypothetical protein